MKFNIGSLFLVCILSHSIMIGMKQNLSSEKPSDEYKKWRTYYTSDNNSFITDACFIPVTRLFIAPDNYDVAITTQQGGIHVFRPTSSVDEEIPLKDSFYNTLISDTKDISGRYLKNIFCSKGKLYVFTNSNLMTYEELKNYTRSPKSQMIQNIGVMQNESLPYAWKAISDGFLREESVIFFDAESGFMAVQKNNTSAIRLTNICCKNDSKLECINSFLDSKEETITSAAYNEKKRLCAFAITNDSFNKMVNRGERLIQCMSYNDGNQKILYPNAEKYLKLVSCTNFLEVWKQPMEASHCTFNEEGTRVVYYAPQHKQVYVSDTSNGTIVYKSVVKFDCIESLSFDENSSRLDVKVIYGGKKKSEPQENKKPLKLIHYTNDHSQKMIVTPESVTVYKKKKKK